MISRQYSYIYRSPLRGVKMLSKRETDEDKLFTGVLRLNARIFGLILGLLMGSAVFLATNWLLIKGGHINPDGEYVVGPHLQLLSQFFIGYRVSFLGSVIGFFYGFALGTLCGAMIGWIYNRIVDFRKIK